MKTGRNETNIGEVVWINDFTAPKVRRELYFECLLTDQKIPMAASIKVKQRGGHIKDWPHEIYKPERFKDLITSPLPK